MANSGIKFTPKLDQAGVSKFRESVGRMLEEIGGAKKYTLKIQNIELMKSAENNFRRSIDGMMERISGQIGIEIKNVSIADSAINKIQSAVKNATSSLTKIDLSNVNKQIAAMDAELSKIGQKIVNPNGYLSADQIREAENAYKRLLQQMEKVKNSDGWDRQSAAASLQTEINYLNQLIALRAAEAQQERERIALAQSAESAKMQAYAKELDAARKQLEALSISSKNVNFTDIGKIDEYSKKWSEVAKAILEARTLSGDAMTDAIGGIQSQIGELQALVTAENQAAAAARDRAKAEQEAESARNSVLKSYETRLSKIGVNTNVSKLFNEGDLQEYTNKLQQINALIAEARTGSEERRAAAADEAGTILSGLESEIAQRRAAAEAAKTQAAESAKAARDAETASRTIAGLEKQVLGLDAAKALKTTDASEIEAYKQSYQELIKLIQRARDTEGSEQAGIIQQIREKINALISLRDGYNNVADASNRAAAEEAKEAAAQTKLQNGIADTLNRLTNLKINNPSVYKAYSAEIDDMMLKLQTGAIQSEAELDAVRTRIKQIGEESRNAGIAGKSFFQQMKAGWEKFGGWTLVTRSFTKVISTFKQMVSAVKEVDSAMTELRKVTDLTASGYDRFYSQATQLAVDVGAKLSDTIQAVSDFSRLGFDIGDATELAEAALLYKNIGDGIADVSTATESLISTMKAFGIQAEESMSIVDMFNEVGNNFAISSAGIGEALQRSASALATAGNTIEQSIGLVVAANDVVQNPEAVGTALKTLTMYIRAAKTEAEDAGISTDGMAESVGKLREELLSLTGQQLDIQIDDDSFKSTYQILEELSGMWSQFTDVTQANILNLLGGKRNANVLSSIIKNFEDAKKASETAANSTGSAWKENEKYLESIEGKTKQLQASFETMANAIINTDLVKTFIDLGKAVADVVTWISQMGLIIPTLTTIVGLVKTIQTTLTATKAANTILGILGSAEGDTTSKINSIKTVVESLGVFAKKLAGVSVASKLGGLTLDADLAKRAGEIATEMTNASLKTLSFSGILEKLKSVASGAGNVLKSFLGTGVGKFTVGVTAAIAVYNVAMTVWNNYVNSLIDGANKVYDAHEDTVKSVTSNKEALLAMQDEFNALKEKVGAYGDQGELTNQEYERYLELCNQIISIVPSMKDAYNEKGASLKTGYIDILDEAIAKQDELLNQDVEITATKASSTLSGFFKEVEKSAGDEKVLEGITQSLLRIKQLFGGDGVKAVNAYSAALKNAGTNIGTLTQLVNVDVEKLDLDEAYELAKNFQKFKESLIQAGADPESEAWRNYIDSFGGLLNWADEYSEKLKKMAEVYKTSLQYYNNELYSVIDKSGHLETLKAGIGDVVRLGASDEENYKSALDYLNQMVFAVYDINDAKAKLQSGEAIDIDAVFGELKEKYSGYDAIINMIQNALYGAAKAAQESQEHVNELTKSYDELAKSMSNMESAVSFFKNVQDAGNKDILSLLKQAQEFADMMTAAGGDIMLDNLFELGEDGSIKWHTDWIKELTEDYIRLQFANTDLAKNSPELVDAIVEQVMAMQDATEATLSFSDALSVLSSTSKIWQKDVSDISAEDAVGMIETLQGYVDQWNKIREQAGEDKIDLTYFVDFRDNEADFSKTANAVMDYQKAMLAASPAMQEIEQLFPGFIDYMSTTALAAEVSGDKVATLSEAMSSFGDVLDAVMNGVSGDNPVAMIQNAMKLIDTWNSINPLEGGERTISEILTIDENGIRTNIENVENLYNDLVNYILQKIYPDLNIEEAKNTDLGKQLLGWLTQNRAAETAKEKADEISDAFKSLSAAYEYLGDHATGEKVGTDLFTALEDFQNLKDKFGDESWNFADFFKFDEATGEFIYQTDALTAAIESAATTISGEVTKSMFEAGQISEEQITETQQKIKQALVDSASQIDDAGDPIKEAFTQIGELYTYLDNLKSYNTGDLGLFDMLEKAYDLADKYESINLADLVKWDGTNVEFMDLGEAQIDAALNRVAEALGITGDDIETFKEKVKASFQEAEEAADSLADTIGNLKTAVSYLNEHQSGGKVGGELLTALEDFYNLKDKYKDEDWDFADFFKIDQATGEFVYQTDALAQTIEAQASALSGEIVQDMFNAGQITEDQITETQQNIKAALMASAEGVAEAADPINAAFTEISDAYAYLDNLKYYRSGDLGLFDMLEKAYELAEKYEAIDLSQLVKWEGGKVEFVDLGEAQINAAIDVLAEKLNIGKDEIESFREQVKSSFAEAEEAVVSLADTMSTLSSALSFLNSHKNGEKVGSNLLAAFQEFYDLKDKYKGENWDFGDFFKLDEATGEILYQTDALTKAVEAQASDVAGQAAKAMFEAGEITEEQITETQQNIKAALMKSAEEIEEEADPIKAAFTKISDAFGYNDDLKKYNEGDLGFFDMLEKAYDLANKYKDIDLKDLVNWKDGEISFGDLDEARINAMISNLAEVLEVGSDELEEFSNKVKKSFEEIEKEVNKYEGASSGISIAGSIQSFIGDLDSGDKSVLDMMSSAVSLAEKLGKEITDFINIDASGNISYNVNAITTAFDSYIDELVTAGKLNETLADKIKQAARAEGELAEEAKTAAERMADALSTMSSLSSFITEGLSGDLTGLDLLQNVQ